MTLLPILTQKSVYLASRTSFNNIIEVPVLISNFCTSSKGDDSKIKLPDPPQNCCMSACANCVWVAYAEEVAKILNDGGETAKQKIIEHIKDPNLRAFLLLELSHLFKKPPK